MRALIVLLCGCFACGPLAASEADELRVSAVVPWTNAEGYTPVVVRLASARERSVQIEVVDGDTSASMTVALGAGDQRQTTLLLPAQSSTWRRPTLHCRTADGRSLELNLPSTHAPRHIAVALVGSEASLPLEPWQTLLDPLNWDRRLSLARSRDAAHRVAVEDLPDRWQGYPTWLLLVVDAAAQARMSPAQREAIALWTVTGGLLVLPEAAQAAPWRQLGARVHVASDPANDAWLREALLARRDESAEPGHQDDLASQRRVPATGFMLVALAFALLVGPLNLLWVHRRNARHLFLITTPLLSLATCAILLVADVALHGLALRRQVQQLVLLDQPQARALGWTLVTAMSAFALGTLDLDPECEALPLGVVPIDHYYHYRPRHRAQSSDGPYRLAWGDRQRASGTWGGARTPTTIRYRTVASERARLELRQDGEALVLTNGLGVDLARATLTKDRHTWTIPALAAGDSVRLALADREPWPADLERLKPFGAVARRAVVAWNDDWHLIAEASRPLVAIPGPSGHELAAPQALVVVRLGAPGGAP